MGDEQPLTEKQIFAKEWLRTGDAFKAALSIVGASDAGKALLMAQQYGIDAEVAEYKNKLSKETPENFLPTKADLARKVWEVTEHPYSITEDKLKALRLYGEIMGFIVKPESKEVKGVGSVTVVASEMDAKL